MYASADARVFGAVVCVNLTSGAAGVNAAAAGPCTPAPRGSAGPSPRQFHVGTHPTVDVALGADGHVYVMEVRRCGLVGWRPAAGGRRLNAMPLPHVAQAHGSGFCPNSETHNKEPSPGVCGQAPSPTPFVLDYTMGSLAAFQDVLASGRSPGHPPRAVGAAAR